MEVKSYRSTLRRGLELGFKDARLHPEMTFKQYKEHLDIIESAVVQMSNRQLRKLTDTETWLDRFMDRVRGLDQKGA